MLSTFFTDNKPQQRPLKQQRLQVRSSIIEWYLVLIWIGHWPITMAVATSGSKSSRSLTQPFNCFKVGSLSGAIIDANQTACLKNQYILGQQLGWGQFGIIRECTDKLNGDVLACKSIPKDRLVTQEDMCSVKLEIEIMTRLSGHPNVVNLKAVYEEEDYVHLVMELCAGGELYDQLEKNGKYSEAEAKVLFRHLMQVVKYCHDHGVVHRDLKPENILLATKASSSPIKLADFGLATYIRPGESLHGTVGSPFYIAPEVLGGGYTQAADVWSAGVILYILLSGNPPFWGKTKSRIFDAVRAADLRFPSEPWDFISEPAKELIEKMLCVDPLKRLTAQQVLDHSWMGEESLGLEEPHEFQTPSQSHLESQEGSHSVTFMSRGQDFSFDTRSHSHGEPQFACRSSFSGFLVEPSTPCLISAEFPFRYSDELASEEISTPMSSMPSFAFFTPSCEIEFGGHTVDQSANLARAAAVQTEAGFGGMFMPPNSSPCLVNETGEMKQVTADAKRMEGSGCRTSATLNKRNRTISLGEFDQLNIMVTESIIRWASCTNLPSAASLRSSLVC